MKREDFENMVDRAIASIPEDFLDQVSNLSFQVEDWADDETLAEVGFDDPRDLLGFYRGCPLDERTVAYAELPDVIVVYQAAVENYVRETGEAVFKVVRETIIHELAHYFGFSEEEMDEIEALWAQRGEQ